MREIRDIIAPGTVLASWLAAAAAFPAFIGVAAIGQAAGGIAGGCSWIGVTLPIHRQPWALVNQPVINFSSTPQALGYWLGSSILVGVVAVLFTLVVPRFKSLVGEIVAVQVAWGAAIVGFAWLPTVDPTDGHLARWLGFAGLPPFLLWAVPVVGTTFGGAAVMRLLGLARRTRQHEGRAFRVKVVVLHLLLPTVSWVVLGTCLGKRLVPAAIAAVAMPIVVGLIVTWYRYPKTTVQPLRDLGLADITVTGLVAILVAAAIFFGGRPLPDGRVRGVVWAAQQPANNIRPWMEVVVLGGLGSASVLSE